MTSGNASETHRHRCEVRWCLRQGLGWFEGYARKVKDARGEEAAKRLWQDVKKQASLGNVGAPGDWRATCAPADLFAEA